jgi:hypothetical protein
MNEDENEKSPNRSHDSSSRDERASIVSSQPTKAKQILAIRVLRQLRYSGSISQIGLQAYAIVCYVAERLDESRYRGLIPLHNGQLTDALGFGNWKILDKYRRAAVDAGWLIYQPQGNRQAGLYGIAIPADCMPDYMSDCMPNEHVNEGISTESTHNSTHNPTHNSAYPVLPNTLDLKPEGEGAPQTATQSTRKGRKSKNSAEPNKPRDLEEVREYFAKAGLRHITAEEYYYGQESQGWITGKDHRPVQNWKANARVWDQTRAKFAAQQAPQPPQPTAAPPQKRVPAENRPPRNRFGGCSQ